VIEEGIIVVLGFAQAERRQEQGTGGRREADEILRECGADGWVAKYEQELEALS
jgi:hypothetical protein